MAVSDWSTTAVSNATVGGVSVAEGMLPGDVNNAIQALMAEVKAKFDEIVSVKDFGATGDGVTDDTDALTAAIASGASALVFPEGTYRTTGIVIPAESSVKALIGIGLPKLQRYGQAAAGGGSDNLYILVIYKNKIVVSGIHFDGINQSITVGATGSTDPVAKTEYADLALNGYVGSDDGSATTDNMVVVTGCYFTDAPGSCIAGSGMQSTIIHGNKFDGWFDHAVYASGEAAQLAADIIVSNNVLKHTRYATSGFAVKVRNRAKRYVIVGNTLDLDSHGFFAADNGGATNYRPIDIALVGNAGECSIFFSSSGSATLVNTDIAPININGNTIRTSLQAFYLGEDASNKWSGRLLVNNNAFINTGSWTSLFNTRFVDNTLGAEIVARHNDVFNYALLDGVFPKVLRVENNRFTNTTASFINSTATDDAVAKRVDIIGNAFIRGTSDGFGTMNINVNESSSWRFNNNYCKNCGAVGSLKALPGTVEFIGNTLEDSTGVTLPSALTPRASVGRMSLERNKCISTAGASVTPRLLNENVASNPLLASYNIYVIENYFKDVTDGISMLGAGVSGYAGSNKIYAVDNYGPSSTLRSDYQAANEATALTALTI